MKLVRTENLRFIDRNKLGAYGFFEHEGQEYRAELSYYAQAGSCLSIKLGRHDPAIATELLDDYLREHLQEMKHQINPEVARAYQERRAAFNSTDSN